MTKTKKKMEIHPVANLFPMLPDDELSELADDIKKRGLLQPIVLDSEGRILDGRNRYAACEIASIEPEFETYAGNDPAGYALSVNINRRHLSKGQRAMAVAMVYPEPAEHSSLGLKIKPNEVNKGALSQARTVLKWQPELAATVMAGLPLTEAYSTALATKKQKEDTEASMVRLKELASDLYDLVEAGNLILSDGIAALNSREEKAKQELDEAKAREKALEEEHKQQRWAATSNLIDGILLFDRHRPGAGAEMAAAYDPEVASARGERITPKRIRQAIAYLEEIATAMENSK